MHLLIEAEESFFTAGVKKYTKYGNSIPGLLACLATMLMMRGRKCSKVAESASFDESIGLYPLGIL